MWSGICISGHTEGVESIKLSPFWLAAFSMGPARVRPRSHSKAPISKLAESRWRGSKAVDQKGGVAFFQLHACCDTKRPECYHKVKRKGRRRRFKYPNGDSRMEGCLFDRPPHSIPTEMSQFSILLLLTFSGAVNSSILSRALIPF